ncbi:MAG: hypothetical protein ACRBDL_04795 [Alphaproteobacteria bacterium]
MVHVNYIPEGYDRIKVVDDLCAFLNEDFAPRANVVLYPRRLGGDFDVLAQAMAEYFDLDEQEIFIKYSERELLLEFRETLDAQNLQAGVDIILSDMEFFYSAGARTHMRLLRQYTEHKDTYAFHVDGLEQDFDRYMTCYNDPVTQFVKNDDVLKILGHDAVCRSDAEVFQFHKGDIWKARVRNKPSNSVDDFIDKVIKKKERRAFVHRAQLSDNPRLMVVGDLRLC